ncbi:peptidoglycan-binding protein [uncultured Roseibium sp.]|uniref:glycoside hydrolase family protein n=1 Tax=uncultured Roseibium sp. TaxID=1936171 RepID=UPI00261935DD|nr:peptidoglycan-binding protein [uncultured Roseibium sp.]
MLTTSKRGRDFIATHEGVVLRAYKDVVGIWTIGVGHTARAGGIKPKPGMKITHEQAMDQLEADLRKFEGRVRKQACFDNQHSFDGATSFDFNTGRIHNATWVKRFREGELTRAEESIMLWVKAGGRKIRGLVNRRNAERRLIFYGDYGHIKHAEGQRRSEPLDILPREQDPMVKEAQELLTARGFNPGAIDGWWGRNTKGALLEYQKTHPHLTNDGILGPATMAQLRRDALVVKDTMQKGGGTVIGSGVLSFFSGPPWQWVVPTVFVMVLLYFGWRNRDLIAARLNKLLGREVD